jgi:hypothetical protein
MFMFFLLLKNSGVGDRGNADGLIWATGIRMSDATAAAAGQQAESVIPRS